MQLKRLIEGESVETFTFQATLFYLNKNLVRVIIIM